MKLARIEPMLASPSTSQGGRRPVALADLKQARDQPREWLFQEKLDGVRAQLRWDGEEVRITGRGGNDLTASFPEIATAVEKSDSWPFSLDGEIVLRGRPNLSQLLSRVKHQRADAQAALAISMPATFHAFDCFHCDRQDLLAEERPLGYRLNLMEEVADNGVSDARYVAVVNSWEDGEWLMHRVSSEQQEGIVAKRVASRYVPGTRSWSWVKFKHLYTLTVIAYSPSGTNGQGVALAMLEGGQAREVGALGAGLTDSVRAHLNHEWARGNAFPLILVDCLGVSAAGRLRQPVFTGLDPRADPLLADFDQLTELPVTT